MASLGPRCLHMANQLEIHYEQLALSIRKLWREEHIDRCDLLKLDCQGAELPGSARRGRAAIAHPLPGRRMACPARARPDARKRHAQPAEHPSRPRTRSTSVAARAWGWGISGRCCGEGSRRVRRERREELLCGSVGRPASARRGLPTPRRPSRPRRRPPQTVEIPAQQPKAAKMVSLCTPGCRNAKRQGSTISGHVINCWPCVTIAVNLCVWKVVTA
jgi:hypothetical protein